VNLTYPIDVKMGDGEVTISWIRPTKNEDGSLLTDLAGYYIYRSEGTAEPFNRLNDEPVKGICYTDTALINGITYLYAVTAVDYSGNESKKSPIISATPNILPPSKVRVKPGDGEVQLFWAPYEKSPLKGYYVYRRNPSEQTFQRITDLPVQESYFIDLQVANGIPYFYKVSCVDMDGIESLPSPEVAATPMAIIPDEPSSVHAQYIQESSGEKRVELSWDQSKEDGIAGYKIYRRILDERDFTLLTPEPVHETTYFDTTIMPDTGYLYSVVAVTEKGMESQYPKEAKCFTAGIYVASFSHDTDGKAKKAGDKICLSLLGEPGMLASYRIERLISNLPMEETGEGIYTDCLEITEEMAVEGGIVMGFLQDPKGNRTSMLAEGTVTIDNRPPKTVKNGKAEWDTGSVLITWEPPEGEFAGFEIFRNEEGIIEGSEFYENTRLPIKTVSKDITNCYDVNIKPDHIYIYKICALDRAGNRSDPLQLSPVHIPYQDGIPIIKNVRENTGGMPQKTGDRIEIELIGEEGCQASFFIPGVIDEAIPLLEKALGQYTGYYIVRAEDQSEQAFIQACLKDHLGHFNCQNTATSLIINDSLNDVNPPVIYDITHNAFEVAGFSGSLVPGNMLEIKLRGEPGCKAFFIIAPSDIVSQDLTDPGLQKQEMLENQDWPGLYKGTYHIGWQHEFADEKYVWACLSDRAGNKVWKNSEEMIQIDTRPRIEVIPENNLLWADQESQTRITVKVTNANGDPVPEHLFAITLTTTDEYTGVVGGGDFGSRISNDMSIDFDDLTDSWGEIETEYTSGFSAKTAIIVAKDLTTGHAGAGYILSMIKAQTDIQLESPSFLSRLLKASPYKLILTADPDRLTADGVSTSWITAQLTDMDGKPIQRSGVLIFFSIDGKNGNILDSQVRTDSFGQASTRYTAGIIRGTVTITGACTSNDEFKGLTDQTKIALMSDAPAIMELAAYPSHLVANGKNQSQIKVWVADINENPVQQAMVEFSILQSGKGALSAITEATDFNGWAECLYTSPDLSGRSSSIATILTKVISKAPTEEELSRAVGTIFVPLLYPEMEVDEDIKILEWLKQKGDDINQGEPIVRIEMKKSEFDLRAPVSGELVKIIVHRGERIKLGQTIGQILADEVYLEED
jgi:fibronectin type 3 domain-containing protein